MPQPFVFVIMPFHKSFTDTYNLGIKPACEAAGAACERVDEQTFVDNILMRIYQQIARANVVVADMTGQNPNVFYEAGFAHGVGKQVILVGQKESKIPFDLTHYPFVIYENVTALRTELERKVRWCLAHPDEGPMKLPGDEESDRMAKHILNYLDANDFQSMSFDRVRERINAAYADEKILGLIDKRPQTFRRVRMAGDRPGIGRL